ncbi:nucleotide disphospho-sugar-binding domain-containing protein [Streptomyces aurantiacus]|uniref:Putative Desosaminyl transferase EryCIII n=1 Tax=Streptomyces aurantiacus JA 4570 TaxID=1286094 RepID=S3ZJY3_9ACTN|nr:nucleotide disphospho-sugar-binding domain-containing protein [Streptomyces aurantiacus]EPH43896.1 putative Desosaminyl transferase EryCIII [Streptomyces aurantiacus JA 4570]
MTMRVLFVPLAAPSHITLMVPLAWALQTAGHEVRFAVPPNHVDSVLRTGLMAVSFGVDVDLGDSEEALPEGEAAEWERLAGLDTDGSYRDGQIRDQVLGAIAAYCAVDLLEPTMDELVALARAWEPDLVVWDNVAFHGSVAARAAGAASARSLVGVDHVARMRGDFLARGGPAAKEGEAAEEDAVAGLLADRLDRYGAAFDEAVLVGDWTVNPLPEAVPAPPGLACLSVRQLPFTHLEALPDWLTRKDAASDLPRVCLTLGRSVRDVRGNDNYGLSVPDLLAAVDGLDAEVIATLTPEQLPAGTAVPDNVRLVDFVPMNALLPTCAAVLHHGGASTLMAAVWARVPQLIVPSETWDERELAAAVEAFGAGLTVGAAEPGARGGPGPRAGLTPDALRAALTRLLTEPTWASGAAAMRRATLAHPAPGEAVPVLERLTAELRSPHA